jgi:hypothetical protein
MNLHLPLCAALLVLGSRVTLQAAEDSFQHRATLTPGALLRVEVDFGSLIVTTNASREAIVDVARTVELGSDPKEEAFLKDRPVQFEDSAEGLLIRSRGPRGLNWNMNWGRNTRIEAQYRISLPADCRLELQTSGGAIEVTGTQAPVKARTSGGRLRFTGLQGPLEGRTSGGTIQVLQSSGPLKVNTSGGSIEVRGGAGTLEADTSGGQIKVRDFAGSAHLDTSGGSVVVENVLGEVTGSTSGGSMSAVLPSPLPGPVRLHTSGGSITVSAPADAKFDLDASTSAGSASSELPVELAGEKKRSRIQGTVNGGGPQVHLRTSGGSIRIKRLEPAVR